MGDRTLLVRFGRTEIEVFLGYLYINSGERLGMVLSLWEPRSWPYGREDYGDGSFVVRWRRVEFVWSSRKQMLKCAIHRMEGRAKWDPDVAGELAKLRARLRRLEPAAAEKAVPNKRSAEIIPFRMTTQGGAD